MTDDGDTPGPLSRRRLLGTLGAGALGGLAGCRDESDDGEGAGTVDSGRALERSSQVIGRAFRHVPEGYNLNPWAAGYLSGFPSFLFEYPAVRTAAGDTRLLGDGDGLTGLVSALDIDGREVTVEYSEAFSWWSGDPVTARDRWVGLRIDDMLGVDVPDVELVDDYTLRYTLESRWREGVVLERVLNYVLNTPAWIYDEYRERLAEATTTPERESVRASLQGLFVDLNDVAERGIGCGPYELVESSPNRLMFDVFEDHPDADRMRVPRAWFPVAQDFRAKELTADGVLDLGQAVLRSRETAGVNPSHIEQLDEHPTRFGVKLALNWGHPDLARRNVRRAIACVIPLDVLVSNSLWGQPARHQTGLANGVEDRWLDEALRERLYRYPVESDTDRGAEFMRRAGYERRRGRWRRPDGSPARLAFHGPLWDAWSTVNPRIEQSLDDFGIAVDLTMHPQASYVGKVSSGNVAMVAWEPTETPFEAYDPDDSLDGISYGLADEGELGKPATTTIPTHPGSLDISDGGLEIDLAARWSELRGPISDERTREIVALFARWWNYELPGVQLVTRTTGVWGNTRDYEWPPAGDPVYRTAGPSNGIDLYLLRSAAVAPAPETTETSE